MNNLLKIQALVLFISVAVILARYLPGITWALYYDDYSNLKGLGSLNDFESAKTFVLNGSAGPLGRPLALLSFLPLASQWPNNSNVLLLTNVLIHAGNFVLFFLIGFRLLRLVTDFSPKKSFYVSLISAFMWAVLPILASATLIAIQRMTGMSAFFGLLGLLGFIAGYSYYKKSPVKQAILQLGILGIGTVLSVYSKESGALFPLYALIIDIFVLGRFVDLNKWQKIKRTILCLPLIFILWYLSPLNIKWMEVSEFRGFSALERLFTQAVILWEYLFKAFIPQEPRAYGPFHDYYGIKYFNFTVVMAVISWSVIIVIAAVSTKKVKWFSFAVFWFLTGHLIESTTILLELYFEHRNYIALYGVCLALTIGAWSVKGRLQKVIPAVQIIYIFLIGVILFSITNLWGDQEKAALSWSDKHPGSARAALHVVFQEMNLGASGVGGGVRQLSEKERYSMALKVLDRTRAACPDCLNVRLQALLYSCAISEEKDKKSRLEEIYSMSHRAELSAGVVDMLFNLSELLVKDACKPLGFEDMKDLISSMGDNPKLRFPEYGGKIYFVEAMADQQLGDVEGVYRSLDKAEALSPNAVPVLQYQVYFALEQGDINTARQAIARREKNASEDEYYDIDRDELEKVRVAVDKYKQEFSE
jgi:hypothetical protein